MNNVVMTVAIDVNPYADSYDDNGTSPARTSHVLTHVLTDDMALALREVMSCFPNSPSAITKVTITRLPVIVPSKY
jgi:hypothetical protein